MKSHWSAIDRDSEPSHESTPWRAKIVVLALLGTFPAFTAGHAGDNLPRLMAFGAFAAILTTWVSIALHELGHAVVSTVVGGPVNKVRIGSGPLLRIHHAFGTTIVLRLFPTCGCTIQRHPTGTAVRLRLIALAGAGVVVNVALIGVALTMLSGFWTQMIVLINGVMIFDNLLPLRTQSPEGLTPTDGLTLLRLLRMSA